MSLNILRGVVLLSATAVFSTGCAIQKAEERESRVMDDRAMGVDLRAQQRQSAEESARPFVRIRDRQWVDTNAIIASRKKLPSSVNCSVSYAPYSASGVYELTQVVQESCGVSIRLTSDAVEYLWAENERGGSGEAQSYQGGGSMGEDADAILLQALGGGGGERLGERVGDLRWDNAPLESLLGGLTSHLGLSWRYEQNDGEIVLFHTQTEDFQLSSIPTRTTLSSSVSSGTNTEQGSQGSSSGEEAAGSTDSSQSTEVELNHDFSEDIRATIGSMLSQYGKFNYSPSTGRLSITDTPDVVNQVASYIERENESLTRQLLIDVKVLSVTLDDTDSLGIDWDLVYNASAFQGGLQSAVTGLPAAAGSGSIRIIDADSRFFDSQLFISALSEQGRVSTITSPSVTTTNMQPVPVQVARQVSYLARTQVTNLEGGQSSEELIPGTITTGFNMTMFPFMTGPSEMLLQYTVDLSELRDLRTVTSGNNTIEIPEVDTRIFSQRVKLRNGETLVLSGFEQESNRSNRSGTGHARNLLGGGEVSSSNMREVIVILITPTFMG